MGKKIKKSNKTTVKKITKKVKTLSQRFHARLHALKAAIAKRQATAQKSQPTTPKAAKTAKKIKIAKKTLTKKKSAKTVKQGDTSKNGKVKKSSKDKMKKLALPRSPSKKVIKIVINKNRKAEIARNPGAKKQKKQKNLVHVVPKKTKTANKKTAKKAAPT